MPLSPPIPKDKGTIPVEEGKDKAKDKDKDAPKKDFKIGQAMGGVVLRIPMK